MKLPLLCILGAGIAWAQTAESEKQSVIQTVERTFRAMAARSSATAARTPRTS